MITAQQARTQTEAFKLQAQANEASRKAHLALTTPRRDAALNRRIDALVSQFIDQTITPSINTASESGARSVSFNTKHYRFYAQCEVDTLIENSLFGALSGRAKRARRDPDSWPAKDGLHDERVQNLSLTGRIFDNSSLARHRVEYWSGGVGAEDRTLQFHILYRAGLLLREKGFGVTLPEIRIVSGCKIDQRFNGLTVRW